MKYGPVTQIPYAMEPGDMDEIIDLVSAYGSASYADGYHSYRSDREEISVSREAFTALLEAISKLIEGTINHE